VLMASAFSIGFSVTAANTRRHSIFPVQYQLYTWCVPRSLSLACLLSHCYPSPLQKLVDAYAVPLKGIRVQSAPGGLTVSLGVNKTRLPENHQVVRERRLRQPQGIRQITYSVSPIG